MLYVLLSLLIFSDPGHDLDKNTFKLFSKKHIDGYTSFLSLSFCIFVDDESNSDYISGIQWGSESKFDRSCLGKYKTAFILCFPWNIEKSVQLAFCKGITFRDLICGCEDQVSILPPLASIVVTSLASQFADYLITNGVDTTTV